SKLQAPKKHQVPNTKHQAPNSREAASYKLEARPRFGAWNLGFLWCLELGFWCFDSGTSLELGVWCLVFCSAVAQKLSCAHRTGRFCSGAVRSRLKSPDVSCLLWKQFHYLSVIISPPWRARSAVYQHGKTRNSA